MRDPHHGIYNAKQPPLEKNPQGVKTNEQKTAPDGGERATLPASAQAGVAVRAGEAGAEHCSLAPASRLGWAWPVQEVASSQEC